jgi:hypothetical protein
MLATHGRVLCGRQTLPLKVVDATVVFGTRLVLQVSELAARRHGGMYCARRRVAARRGWYQWALQNRISRNAIEYEFLFFGSKQISRKDGKPLEKSWR